MPDTEARAADARPGRRRILKWDGIGVLALVILLTTSVVVLYKTSRVAPIISFPSDDEVITKADDAEHGSTGLRPLSRMAKSASEWVRRGDATRLAGWTGHRTSA